jgi:hypothetical protein
MAHNCSIFPYYSKSGKQFVLHKARVDPEGLLNDIREKSELFYHIIRFGAPTVVGILEFVTEFLEVGVNLEPGSIGLIMQFSTPFLIRITILNPNFWTIVAQKQPASFHQVSNRDELLIRIMEVNKEFLAYMQGELAFIDFISQDPGYWRLARDAGYDIVPLFERRENHMVETLVTIAQAMVEKSEKKVFYQQPPVPEKVSVGVNPRSWEEKPLPDEREKDLVLPDPLDNLKARIDLLTSRLDKMVEEKGQTELFCRELMQRQDKTESLLSILTQKFDTLAELLFSQRNQPAERNPHLPEERSSEKDGCDI